MKLNNLAFHYKDFPHTVFYELVPIVFLLWQSKYYHSQFADKFVEAQRSLSGFLDATWFVTEVVLKFISSDIYFPVHGADLWLYFHGSMGSDWIQQPSRVLVAEDANLFVCFVILSFFQTGTSKRSISVEIRRMDEDEVFSLFELQKFL